MPRPVSRLPSQPKLPFEDKDNQPPSAPPTQELLQALADLLLEAHAKMTDNVSAVEVSDER